LQYGKLVVGCLQAATSYAVSYSKVSQFEAELHTLTKLKEMYHSELASREQDVNKHMCEISEDEKVCHLPID
jgi:hypothetical protein